MSEDEEYKKSNKDWYQGLNDCQKTFYMNFLEALKKND